MKQTLFLGSAKLTGVGRVTIQVPDYYHELVMAGPVRSDILARILWRKTYHVLHIARRALTKSDQRAGAARAIRPQVESYAAAQMFLNMGGPIPVENMSQNGSSTMAQYCLIHRYILFFTGGSESLICRIV